MKDPALSWLLDPKDPSVRHQALIDLLHRPKDGKDVLATREKIPSYRPVKKIIATQTSKGIWSPKETCYRPKWTLRPIIGSVLNARDFSIFTRQRPVPSPARARSRRARDGTSRVSQEI